MNNDIMDHCHLLQGAYLMCGRLLTSPRFNRPQREVIEEQAFEVKAQLEEMGVVFTDSASAHYAEVLAEAQETKP